MGDLSSEIQSMLNSLSTTMSKFVDKLIDLGLNVDGGRENDPEEGPNEGIFQIRTANNEVMKVKVVLRGNEKNPKFDLYFKKATGSPIVRKDVAPDQIEQTLTDAIRKLYGEESAKSWKKEKDSQTDPSLKFTTSVKGQKVMADVHVSVRKSIRKDGSSSIKLTGISASTDCDLAAVYSDIDLALTSPDFVSQVPEGQDQWYAISEVDNQIDVQPCDEVSCTDRGAALLLMRTLGYRALFDLQFASWNAQGGDGDKVRNFLESFTWRLQDQLRCLAQLEVECCGTAEYPGTLVQGFERPGPNDTSWDISAAEALVVDRINQYTCALDLYTCLFDKDMQYQMLSWLREWKHVINYQLHGVNAQQVLPCVN
jgi:hypothetical protein